MPRKVTKKERGVYEKVPGSGIWWIRFKHHGVERREKVGRRSDAVALYRDRKTALLRGEKLRPTMRHKGITLAEIGQDAINWYERQKKKDVRTFSGRMRIVMSSRLGSRSAEGLDHNEIEDWITDRGTASGWSPATYNRYKTTISKAYSLAIKNKKVTLNPARLIDNKTEDNERVRYLSDDESENLWAVVKDDYPEHVPALTFALNTGARKSEQFKLVWPDIDISRKQVTLRNTKNGKTRYVQLNRTVVDALSTIQHSKKHQNVFASMRYDAPIKDPKKWFENSVKAAGIEDLTWHDLRHDFISRLVMKGVPLAIVGKIAGHGDPKITARYAHLAPASVQNAVNRLDADSIAYSFDWPS